MDAKHPQNHAHIEQEMSKREEKLDDSRGEKQGELRDVVIEWADKEGCTT